MKSVKLLHLTLKREWFNLMINGTKKIEFRKPSDWIKQRLIGKNYDYIRFVNGYGSDKPYFISEYKGYEVSKKTHQIDFSSGQMVKVTKGDYMIHLGKIIQKYSKYLT